MNSNRPSLARLIGFVLLGCILLPSYVLTLLLALPYSVVAKVTNWYVAQGVAQFGRKPRVDRDER